MANAKSMADMATLPVYVATKLTKKSKSRSTDDGAKGEKKL